jgi:hypothetical protein
MINQQKYRKNISWIYFMENRFSITASRMNSKSHYHDAPIILYYDIRNYLIMRLYIKEYLLHV